MLTSLHNAAIFQMKSKKHESLSTTSAQFRVHHLHDIRVLDAAVVSLNAKRMYSCEMWIVKRTLKSMNMHPTKPTRFHNIYEKKKAYQEWMRQCTQKEEKRRMKFHAKSSNSSEVPPFTRSRSHIKTIKASQHVTVTAAVECHAKDDLSFYDLVGTFMERVDIQISNDTFHSFALFLCVRSQPPNTSGCIVRLATVKKWAIPRSYTALLKNDAKTLHKFRNVFISLRKRPASRLCRRRILSTNYHNFHSVLQR